MTESRSVMPLARREDDLIVRAGFAISPAEIESALLTHPMVRDAAVFGVADHVLGHRLVAVVQLESESDDAVIDKILAAARAHLAEHKIPDLLTAVDAIPRDLFGNIDRKGLARAILGASADGDCD